MTFATLLIWALVLGLGWAVWRREGARGLAEAGRTAFAQGKTLSLRMPLALLAAAFLMQTVPVEALSHLIGPTSGFTGILVASVVGGMLPGGPMVSFPIALVFLNAGAGTPQLIALIAGWSVFAFHRLLAYEAPIMGWKFVLLRMLGSLPVPVLAGLSAELALFLVA